MKYVYYYIDLQDLISYHADLHDAPVSNVIDLSIDGVPESKSGGRSVDILSVQFRGCKQVYVVAILQPFVKALPKKVDIVSKMFLRDFPLTCLELRYIIADAPMRCKIRGTMQYNAKHGCDYCYVAKDKKYYPAATMHGTLRTAVCHAEILRRIRDNQESLDDDDVKGVREESVFAPVIPSLDIINDIPVEKMHLFDLGVSRKMMSLTYYSPIHKKGKLKFTRAPIGLLNAEFEDLKALSDFSRRLRDVDIGHWKAEEFKYLVLGYWPLILSTCPRPCQTVWALTVFIVRAVSLPQEFYEDVLKDYDFRDIIGKWYKQYEKTFGVENCVYNVHMFSHVMKVRELGPVTDTSAFRFEDHYAFLRKSYRAGTNSIGTQAIRNSYLALREGHLCKKTMKISNRVTSKVDDRYIFTACRTIIRVISVTEEDVNGVIIPYESGYFPLTSLNFNSVLVFKLKKDSAAKKSRITVKKANIIGKCIIANDVASVMTENILCE